MKTYNKEMTEGVCIMTTMREDRGKLDLTKRVEELDKSLSIALEINDKYQRENKKLKEKTREAEGETTIIKGIGMNSPEFRSLKKENEELKDDNKKLAEQIQDKNNLVGRLRDKGLL